MVKIKHANGTVLYRTMGATTIKEALEGAYLEGTNLRGAYLRGAYLEGANLEGTNLRGAKYGDYSMDLIPIQVDGLKWYVLILDDAMKIGCELHSTREWMEFNDSEISRMDDGALDWWRLWKTPIMAIVNASGRN